MSSIQRFYDKYKNVESSYIKYEYDNPLLEVEKICNGCKHKRITSYGQFNPKIMFIGYAPSAYELDIGHPFIDKPGQKLSGIIKYLQDEKFGVTLKNNLYATYISWCGEFEDTCNDRLQKEIEVINPKNIILFGDKVSKVVLDKELPRLEKHVITVGEAFYPVFVTYSLEELFYKGDSVRQFVKEDLDFFIEHHE